MKRLLTTVAIFVLCATQLRADVKVTSTTTVEGPVAAMMGGMMPSVVTQIKGMKARTDITMGTMMMSTIVDIDAKHVGIDNLVTGDAQHGAGVLFDDRRPIHDFTHRERRASDDGAANRPPGVGQDHVTRGDRPGRAIEIGP